MTEILDIDTLKKSLQDFADARDWNKFHNSKNLAMALAAEAGELLEIFQWMSESETTLAYQDASINFKGSGSRAKSCAG